MSRSTLEGDLMYAFFNTEIGKVVVYDDFELAAVQALLVGQRFICVFGGEEPVVVELLDGEDGKNET